MIFEIIEFVLNKIITPFVVGLCIYEFCIYFIQNRK